MKGVSISEDTKLHTDDPSFSVCHDQGKGGGDDKISVVAYRGKFSHCFRYVICKNI